MNGKSSDFNGDRHSLRTDNDNPTLESSSPVPIMLASTQQTRVLAKAAWLPEHLPIPLRASPHLRDGSPRVLLQNALKEMK